VKHEKHAKNQSAYRGYGGKISVKSTEWIYAGTCRYCKRFFDYVDAYVVSKDGKLCGNGIDIECVCRTCRIKQKH